MYRGIYNFCLANVLWGIIHRVLMYTTCQWKIVFFHIKQLKYLDNLSQIISFLHKCRDRLYHVPTVRNIIKTLYLPGEVSEDLSVELFCSCCKDCFMPIMRWIRISSCLDFYVFMQFLLERFFFWRIWFSVSIELLF